MNRVPTNDDVIKIIADEIAVDPGRLHPGAKLNDLGVDSLTVMEVLFTLEERFALQLEVPENAQFTTFGDLLEDLHRQLGMAAKTPVSA